MSSTGCIVLQEAVVPPLAPVQDQVYGPEPETELAVPAEQRLVVGVEVAEEPAAEPQAPLTSAPQVQDVEPSLVETQPVPFLQAQVV